MTDADRQFMELARHIGTWSKDPQTKVGCVIVGPDGEIRSTGCNGFPRGVRDDVAERRAKPDKYRWTEHAERNAIYTAARTGIPLKGCQMYLPWFPCMDCTRAIVQVGLRELVALEPNLTDPVWGEDFRLAVALLAESDVCVRWYQDERGNELGNETTTSSGDA
jgi:dCMP deaminase